MFVFTHALPHRVKPALQEKPQPSQAIGSHVAIALSGGAGHGSHREPHELTLLSSLQVPLQSWKPLLQWLLHEVPSHVATAFVGTGQGVQRVPHALTLVLGTHRAPHACASVAQLQTRLASHTSFSPQFEFCRQPSRHRRAPVSQYRPA